MGSGVFAASLGAASSASAQGAYPNRPITVICTAGVGTVTDIIARLLSQHMSNRLGQPMVVENLAGASGIQGTEKLARAPKDGYTIAVVSADHAINPSIFKTLPYDSVNDFTPLSVLVSTPLVLVVNPSLPAKNIQELLALARAKPDSLNYGSAGLGSALNIAGLMLNAEGDVKIRHVPYANYGQMITDVMSGTLQMSFAGIASVAGHIESGKLRAIAVSVQQRVPALPNVPTIAESGLSNYSLDSWVFLSAPAGIPVAVRDRLHAEVKATLALPEVQSSLAARGLIIVGSAPDAATQYVQANIARYGNLIQRSGAAPQ